MDNSGSVLLYSGPEMRTRALRIIAVAAGLLAACSPPKYSHYRSVSGDWAAYVPYGWDIVADADHDGYAQAQFMGPFDPDFYLGAPSLSVRWYKRYRPHLLRDNTLEMYSDADDFINQMLDQVYGKDSIIYGAGRSDDNERTIIRRPEIPAITLRESGLSAKYFAVMSPTPAAPHNKWGVRRNPEDGRLYNVRYHEFAVVPMPSGFYVLCYPATRGGHDKAIKAFDTLIQTFVPYTDGPGGPKFKLPPASAGR